MSDLAQSYRSSGFNQRLGFGSRPALVVVDFVNAYLMPDGPLYAGVEDVVPAAESLLGAARAAGIPVIFTKVMFRPNGRDGGTFYRKAGGLSLFVGETEAGAIVGALAPTSTEPVLYKQGASAFFGTALEDLLRQEGVDTVVIAGLSTSGCVRATAVDAVQMGFVPIVVRQAVGDRDNGPHEASLFDLDAKYADVMDLDEVLEYLRTLSRPTAEVDPSAHFVQSIGVPLPKVMKAPQVRSARSAADASAVRESVQSIVQEVRERGDDAVRELSQKFDHWSPDSFRLDPDQIDAIISSVPDQVISDILEVQKNVRQFAEHQLHSMREFEVETMPGVRLGQKHLPVHAVGAYVPGGRYPLVASAHMTVVTAKVAGVERVTACTPPIRGEIPAATVAAMHLAGADEILLLGGVQAVAAMALGTETIGKVDMLAGPGNAYVAEAKRQLFGEVGIDLFAGPTEILVISDDAADPFVVAVDLLSQAEHGPDSPAILISTSEHVAVEVMAHIERLLPGMPTKDCAEPAWRDHGQVYVVDGLDAAFTLADTFASEHVQVMTEEPRLALERMRNYGALFLGSGTCVSYGDKVIGTNHTLPTRGAARYTGGLWVGKYLKTVTYQEVLDTASSAALGELCGRAARVELFEGHARSGDVRAAALSGAPLSWADWS